MFFTLKISKKMLENEIFSQKLKISIILTFLILIISMLFFDQNVALIMLYLHICLYYHINPLGKSNAENTEKKIL